MVRDAESHSAEDRKRKEEVEERNLADSAAYRSEKSLAEIGDKISADQKSELEGKIADVRAALATDDVERIKRSREDLEQAFFKISQSMYGQPGAGAGADYADAQPGADQGEARANDDTIEGEYKEM
jgi:molecular chaperone DnaK